MYSFCFCYHFIAIQPRLLFRWPATVIKLRWPATVSQYRRSHSDCQTMFWAISKEIHKTFIPGSRSFKDFSYAHNASDFCLFVYKIHTHCTTSDQCKYAAERRVFRQIINQRIEDHPDFFNFICFSDEAHFHISGHADKQNMQIYIFGLRFRLMSISIAPPSVEELLVIPQLRSLCH